MLLIDCSSGRTSQSQPPLTSGCPILPTIDLWCKCLITCPVLFGLVFSMMENKLRQTHYMPIGNFYASTANEWPILRKNMTWQISSGSEIKSWALAVGFLRWRNYLPELAKQNLLKKILVSTATVKREGSLKIVHICKRDTTWEFTGNLDSCISISFECLNWQP